MVIKKNQIEEALNSVFVKGDTRSIVSSGLVNNILVFGDEVNVDLTIHNPTLHAKKAGRGRYFKSHSRSGISKS